MKDKQNQALRKRQQRLDIIATILARGIFTLNGIGKVLEEEYGIVTRTGKRIAPPSISRDLKTVDEMLLMRITEKHKTVKMHQQLKLEYLYREAIEAWLKSKEDKETSTQESVEGESGQGSRTKVQIKTEGQSGDPALLNAARSALADISKLWGLNDPALIDIAVAKAPLNSTDIHQAMSELKEWENDIKAIEGEAIEIDG